MTTPSVPPVISDQTARTVRYSLTRGDILRWQFYVLRRQRVLVALVVIFGIGLAWNDWRRPEFAGYTVAARILYSVLLVCIMLCVVGGGTMAVMALTVLFKKYRGLLGEHELEIRDDGLVERTDVNESVHRWAGFHKIVPRRRYLYIYVTDNNVHIVPRHYFSSEQAERAFRDELEKHVNAAKARR